MAEEVLDNRNSFKSPERLDFGDPSLRHVRRHAAAAWIRISTSISPLQVVSHLC
jgi:hypothetical protein